MIGNIVAAITSSGAPDVGDFESIQTVTVGAGGASSITFSSIPSTFQHLQIRAILRDDRASSESDFFRVRFNGDTGSNYFTEHSLGGTGSSAYAGAGSTNNSINVFGIPAVNAGSNRFGVLILDLLDYGSVNKNKTTRALVGYDNNGSGNIALTSGLWMNSSTAVNQITLTGAFGNFVQHSHAALYGIRG